MTAISAKLYEAFEKIRLGKVEEGTRLFDRVDGFDTVKSVALAELSYFRHDWKRGMQFVRDFLESEQDWETVRGFMSGYKEHHLTLLVLCACQLDAWKESRAYLQQLKKKQDTSANTNPNTSHRYKNYNMYHQAISLISDPENIKRRFWESRPRLKEEGKINLESLERIAKTVVPEHRSRRIERRWKQSRSFDDVVHDAYSKAATEVHLTIYERYSDRLDKAKSHQEAAKSYIALGNEREAKEAIRRYLRCWEFKEPFQVAPIVLFTDHELWAVMSDRRFTESLLTIPHHRES
ncbi:MAG: hypothetical protein FWE67_02390 [Planctomycetaceae bacterium]|nr:hypothetical protein [Planctomycetaceae bacterium]